MKETPFHSMHVALGAKMAPFAGFDMPVEYSGIIEEHMAVINDCGVFDVSHMGEFWVKGPHALDLLQKIASNNVAALTLGKIQYTTLLHENGGIVDDFLIYYYEEEKYLCVVNAANIEKDFAYFKEQNTMGAKLENASDNMAQLAIQGPKALDLLQKLTSVDLKSIPYYSFKEGTFADVEQVILSHTGYTGCGGFEIYFYPKYALQIWGALFKVGDEFGLKPVGLGARDTLRLEAGFCLYGHELNDETTPIQAGLGWITKFVDGKEMLAKELLLKQKKEGVSEKLVGIELTGRGIPREGYLILDKEGNEIGHVTSGTMSPTRRVGIAMGYVKVPFNKVGTEVDIAIRKRVIPAIVVKPPFRK